MPASGWERALASRFSHQFGDRAPLGVAVAPGRVNLIGEHTDYNDGYVLPMAIDRHVAVAFAPREGCRIRVHATAFDLTHELDLEDLRPPGGSEWISYIAGVVWALGESGRAVTGANLLVDGDVPLGSGLSSSAALELATARALCAVSGHAWLPQQMARLAQKAENVFVGVSCGLMDQLAAAVSQEDSALLIDCRSLDTEVVPIPEDARIVVMDTGAPRLLAASAYNERRASCERAVEVLRDLDPEVRALRDVGPDLLRAGRDRMDDVTFRRASHVVAENQRPHALARALGGGDLAEAGRLMNDSHTSLRDLYEVSSSELDRITELAREHRACFGARLTGAGFGGCGVALVQASLSEAFVSDVGAAYRARVDLPGAVFTCRASAGARLL